MVEEHLNWAREFAFRASNGAVTDPVNMSYLQALANHFGFQEPIAGSWIITIAFHYEIFEPINMSWHQAIAEHFGFATPINNSWKYTLAFVDAVEPVSELNWEDADVLFEDADEWILV